LVGSGYGRKRDYLEEGDKYSGYVKCWEFLNNTGTLSFSGQTLHCGVN